ncbi:hypothetical protein [Halomicrobium urmianum]|uniref:hypothetical protein n=1 Tax=Halomicrobium urmianum TaxID=1586233 RepID=UPI001CD9EC3C|nr:hypothetical protein [Halomicrobium urmianum]
MIASDSASEEAVVVIQDRSGVLDVSIDADHCRIEWTIRERSTGEWQAHIETEGGGESRSRFSSREQALLSVLERAGVCEVSDDSATDDQRGT